jgi:hypothetical protein
MISMIFFVSPTSEAFLFAGSSHHEVTKRVQNGQQLT